LCATDTCCICKKVEPVATSVGGECGLQHFYKSAKSNGGASNEQKSNPTIPAYATVETVTNDKIEDTKYTANFAIFCSLYEC